MKKILVYISLTVSLVIGLIPLAAFFASPHAEVKKEVKKEDKRKVVIIDPGHGGMDSGATNNDQTVKEKDINYNLSLHIKDELEKNNYKVIFTRIGDDSCKESYDDPVEDLKCRVKVDKKNQGDIFISIHANSSYNEGRGGLTVYYNETEFDDGNKNPYPIESKKLAETIHEHLISVTNQDDLGVQNANFYVNRMADSPSVLLEVGFVTNNDDVLLLTDDEFLKKYASSIKDAVNEYFMENKKN